MPDKSDRGTHNDPEWDSRNLTGGNDSGASAIDRDKLDVPQGPDLTARFMEETGGSVAGSADEARRVAHEDRDWPGTRSQPNQGGDEGTDESGRIAAADSETSCLPSGGARDPRVTGAEQ
jgi:hypothetical protein